MTDWDAYYRRPAPTASLTRRYTMRWLIRAMRRHAPARPLEIVEFGGGNSFCCRAIIAALDVARYDAADLNEASLAMFRRKMQGTGVRSTALRTDLLAETPAISPADVVFSVGLVEHFTSEQSRIVAARHFDLVRPGGIVIITAPTPTPPYRATRWVAERLGMWAFPDERPMQYAEVEALDGDRGRRLVADTLWPLVLTQRAVVWRAGADDSP
jgi:cyclopropane fatty-acyl-phospholipid synthase-like methyltransferase